MSKIDIEQVTDGMVLEDPVMDLNGRVLMKEGSVISEKTIRILKMWGVVEVTIVDLAVSSQEPDTAKTIDPRIFELAEAEAKVLFRHAERKDPFVDELFRLATVRIAKAWSKGATNVQ